MKHTPAYPRWYLYQRLVKAKLFIDAHYNEAIDLDNISDEACFSKFHFIRNFKKIFGRTPHQYPISLRVEKAKELLLQNKPIAAVCFSVGFESINLIYRIVQKTSRPYTCCMAGCTIAKAL